MLQNLTGSGGLWTKLLKWTGAAIIFRDYVAEVAVCSGESMEPTLRNWGDAVLIEKLTPLMREVEPGTIVVAVSPLDPHRMICKRLVAVEGDYAPGLAGALGQRIPKGHVWLEGDNPARSLDSREFGPVPIGLIRGRVLCKVWPLSELGAELAARPRFSFF